MRIVLFEKLRQHPELKNLLLETGEAKIIEDCTYRDKESARFWGAVKINGEWIGRNILGKLWMELRNVSK